MRCKTGVFAAMLSLTTAGAGAVDMRTARLDEHLPPHIDLTSGNEKMVWVGLQVSDVLPTSGIARILLVEANTTAPARVNVRNVVATLEAGGLLESAEPYRRQERDTPMWVAVVEMKDGAMFSVRFYSDWAELSQERRVGAFRTLR